MAPKQTNGRSLIAGKAGEREGMDNALEGGKEKYSRDEGLGYCIERTMGWMAYRKSLEPLGPQLSPWPMADAVSLPHRLWPPFSLGVLL